MNQFQLFRNTDGGGSQKAAECLIESGRHESQCQRVLFMVQDHPGLTSSELAALYGVDRYMVARRLADLRNRGMIRSIEPSEDKELEWWPKL